MSARFGLICAAAVVMIGGVTGSASAQAVSFTGSGYAANNPPAQPSTIAPYGTFSVPMNMAGQYRVAVDYGILDLGAFKPYAPVPMGVPALSYSAAQNVAAAGGTFNWSVASQNASGVDKNTQIRARLQRSTDNGVTWVFIPGASGLLQALPTPAPGGG